MDKAIWTMTDDELCWELEKAWNDGYEARRIEEESEYVQYGVIYRDYIENPYRRKN